MSLSLVSRLHVARGFLSLVRDPRRLDDVLDLSDRLAASEDAAEQVPAALRAIARELPPHRPLPPLADLRLLPEGTVGREYARFLDAHRLSPDAIPPVADGGDLARLRAHVRGAHDLWHVVTGWTPDLLGELGLQAFYLAQLRVAVPALILTAGLTHASWKRREHLWDILDAVAEGWRQGQEAGNLATIVWNDWMEIPLDLLRQSMRVTPAAVRPQLVVPLVA